MVDFVAKLRWVDGKDANELEKVEKYRFGYLF